MKILLTANLLMGLLLLFVGIAQADMDRVPATPEDQVTLMNWTQQPHNHWSFRNMGIKPILMVPRAGNISDIEKALDSSIPNIQFEYDGKPYSVESALKADDIDGYIVIKDNKILHEEYFGQFTQHDQHLWASSTKSLVGLCIGILVEEGKLQLNEKAETYVSELKGTHFGQRTLREILNMVSALDYTEDYVNFAPGAVSTEYFRRLGLIPAFDLMAIDPTQDDTPRGIIGFLPLFKQNPNLETSYKFEYQSPNVDVAGWIIARVTGKPVHDFIAERVWSKLGVEHDALFMTDVNFNPVTTGGFNTTLRDFARVGLAVVNDGQYNGHQIFPADWIADTFALTNAERKHVARSVYKNPEGKVYDEWLSGYKNFLWVHDAEKGIGTFRGVFGQILYINREENLVIATFSSAASASNAARASNKPRLAAFEAIAKELK